MRGRIIYFGLLVILFLNLFTIIKQGFRINYYGELLLFVLFLISSLIILFSVYKQRDYSWFIIVFFILSLVNLFYIKHAFALNPNVNVGLKGWLLFGTTLLLNAVGFLIGAYLVRYKTKSIDLENLIEEVVEPKLKETEQQLDSYAENLNEAKKEEAPLEPWPSVTELFYPGKFIASNRSDYYHAPKCDWAKKIAENRRVWFKSEQEAKKKGFKKHSCLKK
jgi:hypothetical protein